MWQKYCFTVSFIHAVWLTHVLFLVPSSHCRNLCTFSVLQRGSLWRVMMAQSQLSGENVAWKSWNQSHFYASFKPSSGSVLLGNAKVNMRYQLVWGSHQTMMSSLRSNHCRIQQSMKMWSDQIDTHTKKEFIRSDQMGPNPLSILLSDLWPQIDSM